MFSYKSIVILLASIPPINSSMPTAQERKITKVHLVHLNSNVANTKHQNGRAYEIRISDTNLPLSQFNTRTQTTWVLHWQNAVMKNNEVWSTSYGQKLWEPVRFVEE